MSGNWKKSEPYRFLFPLGVVLALVGVSLWPAYAYKLIERYPGIPHSRLMIEGFAACFILGFLGTALPNMLMSPGFSLVQMGLWCGGLAAAAVLHLLGLPIAGDLTFIGTLLLFFACVLPRFVKRTDQPPPGLLVVFLGLLAALSGALLQVLFLTRAMPAFTYPFSRLLLNQAFLLLPVMGVGAYILPVFVGYKPRQSAHLLENVKYGWGKEALYMLSFGVAIVASMLAESFGYIRTGNLSRGIIILVFLLRHLPVYRRQKNPGTTAWLSRLSLIALPIGYLLIGLWPDPSKILPWLHVVYLNGLALLITSVATRVIVAHGGLQKFFFIRWPTLWWVFGFVTLAMATRVSADWIPARRFDHYAYAAITWMIAMLLWLFAMRRALLHIAVQPMNHQEQMKILTQRAR